VICNATAADAAVPARILGEILLVIFLGVVELRRLGDLRGDVRAMHLRERRLVAAPALLGLALLRVRGPVDSRAVLGAHVAALAHALRRVVRLPERLEQRL